MRFNKILLLTLAAAALLVSASPVSAARSTGLYGLVDTGRVAQYDSTQSIESIIATVVQVALSLLGIVFFAMTFYAGVRWLTARGNEEFVTRAKDSLTTAITGLIIVVASYALVSFVIAKLNL